MPNWVKTIVNISGERSELEKLQEFVRSENSVFSFNKIIPMPEELNMVSGGLQYEYVQCYINSLSKREAESLKQKLSQCRCFFYGNYYNKFFDNKREIDEDMMRRLENNIASYPNLKDKSVTGIGKQYVENVLKYGTDSWYDWCCENWDTKWDACDASLSDAGQNTICYEFDTAWSLAEAPLRKLLQLFPSISIYGVFADEDLGTNCGSF